ncbi:MAG: right-handed parallel beta-helix repeat-containing protein [Spirochaetales bacterium]|jgi:hypothetical protein|nr:right-handed parallel beta-helix repeat-containing protein [Spirochaetales bacterium]
MRKLIVLGILSLTLFSGCHFFLNPGASGRGNAGTLTLNFGGPGGNSPSALAIASGGDLPADLLAALRYEVVFTGPDGEALAHSVASGETLSLTLALGDWRIDVSAYYQEGDLLEEGTLVGTGSTTVPIEPGPNSARLVMRMAGPLYGITIPSLTGGSVVPSFPLAFEGTPITLTVRPDERFGLKSNTLAALEVNGDPVSLVGAGATWTFAMPAGDVTVAAEFISGWRYVKEGASGTGLSWADASGDPQRMMDEAAAAKAEGAPEALVRVAAGTYKPRYKPNSDGTTDYTTSGDDRGSTFILREGVEVRGGYPAGGGDDASRNINPATNNTILSGDIGTANNNTDNVYQVVLGVNIPAGSGTILDGFTISGGYADGARSSFAGKSIDRTAGGGMYNDESSPVLTNVILSGNLSAYVGGGMYNKSSSPILTNVTISGNTSNSNGGGMRSESSSLVLMINGTISGNTTYNSGGGISSNASSLVLTNVTISGNKASSFGGGMTNEQVPSSVLTNVTISGNKAGSGAGGMLNASSSPQIRNSIIWGNAAAASPGISNDAGSSPAIAYSIVQGSSVSSDGNVADPGTGSTNSPFADWQDPADTSVTMPNSAGDYRLKSGSPAINRGDPAYNPAGAAALDRDGTPRIKGGRVDLGAYERE